MLETTERRLPRPRRFTILVVDDDDVARVLLHDLLCEEGYQVLQAANAARALELFSEHDHAVDLLLTDVRLGAMNGVELAQHVRCVREIPVMFMTGLEASQVSGGMFVPKPIDIVKLLELIESELARRHTVDSK